MTISFQKQHPNLKDSRRLLESAEQDVDQQKRILMYRRASRIAYDLLMSGSLSEHYQGFAREIRVKSKNKEIDLLINQHQFDEVTEAINSAVITSMKLGEHDSAIRFINKSKRATELMRIIELDGAVRL